MAGRSPTRPRIPIVTLTSDFGLRDPFVGVMKGVILGICPRARLVDLTHDVAPQDVLGGQLALESATRFFPPRSVHLAVVDPGVGSVRRPLALLARGHYFVGPDNGLFTFALAGGGWSAVVLESPAYRLSPVSQTFHGRDLFAPAAAHLAQGVPLGRLGPRLTDPVWLPLPVARMEGRDLVGEVIAVDRFGNLITSATAEDLRSLGGGPVTVEVGGVTGPLVTAYAEGSRELPRGIVGSGGRLEIFLRDGDARLALGIGLGTRIRVRAG